MGGKDGRGLKLEKLARKNHQKNLWFVLSDEIFDIFFIPLSTGAFCVSVKVLSNDFSTEMI